MDEIKNKVSPELKSIYEESRSLITSLTTISKKYRFSMTLLLLWIISIPFLFYLLNNTIGVSNELLRIELPVILSWGPILLSLYHGIIRISD